MENQSLRSLSLIFLVKLLHIKKKLFLVQIKARMNRVRVSVLIETEKEFYS